MMIQSPKLFLIAAIAAALVGCSESDLAVEPDKPAYVQPIPKDAALSTTGSTYALVNALAYHWKSHAVLDGVSVVLEDASGNLSTDKGFTSRILPVGSYQVSVTPPAASGLRETAIDMKDALAVMKLAIGVESINGTDTTGKNIEVSAYQRTAADFNADGRIDLKDAVEILKYSMGTSATAAKWQYFQDTEVIAAGATPKNELTSSKRAVAVSGTTSVGVAAVLVGDVDGSWRPSQTTAQVDPTYYTSLVSSLQATDKSVTLARWGMEGSGASTTKKVVSRTYQDGIETLTYSDGSQVKSGATKLSASLSIDGLFKYLTYLFPDDTENNAIQQVSGTAIPSVASNEQLRTLSTPLGPYQSGVDIYSKGDYSILNNLWGITPDLNLKNGTDYLSTIKYSPASLQSNVTFLWKFPDTLLDAQGSKLYAYPEIGYRKPLPLSGYNNPGAAIAQLRNIRTFEVEYSVTLIGDSSNYSLMHDLWVFDEKGVISGELGIYPQPDYWTTFWNGPNGYFSKLTGAETYIYTDNGYQWNLVVSPKKNMQEVDSWWYLMTPKDKNQSSPKKIDILKIIQFLFSKGKINPDHYVRGIELGNEIHKGTGGMIINDYAVTFATK